MFIIIVLLSIMGLITTDIFTPSLPHIASVFNQSVNAAQLTISLFLAGFAISQAFYGPISDYVGRKKPIVAGIIIFILGSIVCVYTNSFLILCLGRIIQGLGVGAGLSLARVILRDLYQGNLLAVRTSQVATFVSATPAVAPFVGGLIEEHLGFHAIFIFMLCYGLLLLSLMFYFKETIAQKKSQFSLSTTLQKYSKLLKQQRFVIYAIISGLAFASIILYANVIPFIIQTQLKLSAETNGYILLFAALGTSFSAFISSHLVKYFHPKQLILVGLSLFSTSGLLMLITSYYFGTWLLFLIPLIFIITMGCGFIFPNAIAVCFAEIHTDFGIAGAVFGSIQILVSMLVNLILNNIHQQGQALLGFLYLTISLVGLILFYLEKQKSASASSQICFDRNLSNFGNNQPDIIPTNHQ